MANTFTEPDPRHNNHIDEAVQWLAGDLTHCRAALNILVILIEETELSPTGLRIWADRIRQTGGYVKSWTEK